MPNANVHARLVFFKAVNVSMRKFLTHYPKMWTLELKISSSETDGSWLETRLKMDGYCCILCQEQRNLQNAATTLLMNCHHIHHQVWVHLLLHLQNTCRHLSPIGRIVALSPVVTYLAFFSFMDFHIFHLCQTTKLFFSCQVYSSWTIDTIPPASSSLLSLCFLSSSWNNPLR